MSLELTLKEVEHLQWLKDISYYNHNYYKLVYPMFDCTHVYAQTDEFNNGCFIDVGVMSDGNFTSKFHLDGCDLEYPEEGLVLFLDTM